MNTYLLVSGILLVLTALVHTVLGEKLILMPMQTATLPSIRGSKGVTKRTLRFAWHVTSVLAVGIACVYFHYATYPQLSPDQVFVLKTLSLTFFASFVVSIVGSKAQHPSWIVFLIVSVLTWIRATGA